MRVTVNCAATKLLTPILVVIVRPKFSDRKVSRALTFCAESVVLDARHTSFGRAMALIVENQSGRSSGRENPFAFDQANEPNRNPILRQSVGRFVVRDGHCVETAT